MFGFGETKRENYDPETAKTDNEYLHDIQWILVDANNYLLGNRIVLIIIAFSVFMIFLYGDNYYASGDAPAAAAALPSSPACSDVLSDSHPVSTGIETVHI